MIYEEFIKKNCNRTGRLGYTKEELRSLFSGYNNMSKGEMCFKLFKHFYKLLKTNPQEQYPSSYNLYNNNITDSIDKELLKSKLNKLPSFIYYNIDTISPTLHEIRTKISQNADMTKHEFITYNILLDSIKLQSTIIPNYLRPDEPYPEIITTGNLIQPIILSKIKYIELLDKRFIEIKNMRRGSTEFIDYLIDTLEITIKFITEYNSTNEGLKKIALTKVKEALSLDEVTESQRQKLFIIEKKFKDLIIEEDDDDYIDISLVYDSVLEDIESCPNDDMINLEKYDLQSDDIFTIYYLNSKNKFTTASCVSKHEMKEYISSEDINSPSIISTIWKGGDKSGVGGEPTCKFIIKLPPNNIWVTIGSFDRMINSNEKNWYLLPLYGGKRRRIGYNFGVGKNHGQIPGSYIYKAFTKQEIKNNIKVTETFFDYPMYFSYLEINKLKDITQSFLIETIKKHFK